MAKVIFNLSSKGDKDTSKSKDTSKKQILIRFQPYVNGKVVSMRAKSGLFIDKCYWDNKNNKVVIPESKVKMKDTIKELRELRNKLEDLKDFILTKFNDSNPDSIDSKWLASVLNNTTKEDNPQTVYDMAEDYLIKAMIADSSKGQYKSTFRLIFRYEAYIQATSNKNFIFDVNTLTSNDIESFRIYTQREKEYYDSNPELFKDITSRYPEYLKGAKDVFKKRDSNAIVIIFSRVKTFWYWLINQEYTSNNPFTKFKIGSMHFAEPNSLTKDERNDILNADLKDELKTYRDIFVFQCYVGCRVSDLKRLTIDDIIPDSNGDMWLIYTPQKTRNKGTDIAQAEVSLQPNALKLIDKYRGKTTANRLMPDFDVFKYDLAIKKILQKAGVDRPVETRNGKKPLYEIAGSHLARRSFVSIMYNNSKIKDLNAIAMSTGHRQNSKALTTRYCKRERTLLKEMAASLD